MSGDVGLPRGDAAESPRAHTRALVGGRPRRHSHGAISPLPILPRHMWCRICTLRASGPSRALAPGLPITRKSGLAGPRRLTRAPPRPSPASVCMTASCPSRSLRGVAVDRGARGLDSDAGLLARAAATRGRRARRGAHRVPAPLAHLQGRRPDADSKRREMRNLALGAPGALAHAASCSAGPASRQRIARRAWVPAPSPRRAKDVRCGAAGLGLDSQVGRGPKPCRAASCATPDAGDAHFTHASRLSSSG